MRKWKCTVCGYQGEDFELPETCPVCSAPKAKFVLVEDEPVEESPAETAAVVEEPEKAEPVLPPLTPVAKKQSLVMEMFKVFRVHPVAAHFPEALLPTSILAAGAYLFLKDALFADMSMYLAALALVVVPVSLLSGLYEWIRRYRGVKPGIFLKKITLALMLAGQGAIGVWLHLQYPQPLTYGGWPMALNLALLFSMTGCVVLLGHYGAMLVFHLDKLPLKAPKKNGKKV